MSNNNASRKHPLRESLSENTCPPRKRCRFEDNVRRTEVERNHSFSEPVNDEGSQPSFRIIRNGLLFF